MMRALPGLVAAAVLVLFTPAAARAQASITLSPNAASLIVDETQDFTAIVTGTNNKAVKWKVCNGKGRYCTRGGNSTIGTVVEIGQDASGNPIARYTAPSTAPQPTLCVINGDGCQVVLKAKLAKKKVKAKAEIILFAPPLAITTDWLPYGVKGGSYSATAVATGGTEWYTWSLIGGTLPPGVSFSSGDFYGWPSQDGTFNFTIQVADQGNPQQIDTRDFSITITRDLRVLSPPQLYDGVVGQSFGIWFEASGGQGPYFWSESTDFFDASGAGTAGTPCEGLTLNLPTTSTLLDLNGTPVRSGTCGAFIVQLTDSSDPPQVFGRRWSFSTYDPLVITTTSLPDASTDAVYEFTPQETGGKPPYLWLLGTALPDGLVIDNQTGRISGAPQVAGTFDVTLELRDHTYPNQWAQRPLALIVHAGEPAGRNDSIATATQLVSGRFRASISPYQDPVTGLPRPDTDYYWMTAYAGEIVNVAVLAQRLYPPSPLDPVIEIVDANGSRFTTCRNFGGVSGAVVCLNDDTIDNTDSFLQFLVPGTPGTPLTFYIRVLDFRGDARPDLRYEISIIVYPPT